MSDVLSILVTRVVAENADIRALVEELDRELSAHYPPEQRHGLKLDTLFQPHIRFFVASRGGAPAGCGGVALFAGFGEIKRMYVRADLRGQGVADEMIRTLEDEALRANLGLLRLETGIHQPAAIAFYTRHGYRPCAAFEPYTSMAPHAIATSIFLEKQLRA